MDAIAFKASMVPFAPIAPLNILSKHTLPTINTKVNTPTSKKGKHWVRSPLSAQSLLEANVRFLCDMVDTAMKGSSSLEHSLLSIQTNTAQRPHRESKFVLSPRTFSLAKDDISQVDEGVVSKMSSDTLLTLFPTPPQRASKVSEAKSRRENRKRQWAIPPGVVIIPPTEDVCPYSHAFPSPQPISNGHNQRQRAAQLPPVLVITPHSEPDTSSSECLGSAATPVSTPSGLLSPASLSSMDALSQRLLAIESQMRRASFLVNRRTSILSTLFTSNAVSPMPEPIKATLAPAPAPVKNVPLPSNEVESPSVYYSPIIGRPSSSSFASDMSDTSTIWYSAVSSPVSTLPPTPTSSNFRFGLRSKKASSPLANSSMAVKDVRPERWEMEGQKWSDRFQGMLHNFQSAAGKHSKKLTEIIPKTKSRWGKRFGSK